MPLPELTELLNAIPHGIALLDSDLRLITINRFLEALTGYTREEVASLPADAVLRSNFSGRRRPWQRALRQGDQVADEGDVISADRRKIAIRFIATPLFSGPSQPAVATATSTAAANSVPPPPPTQLLLVLEDISLLKELDKSRRHSDSPEGILGHSPGMQEIFELLPVLAHTDSALLITGETGTGKDLLAEVIHRQSRRAGYPFIKVNCGALPESLLESELFGHAKGAFTGATADKPGLFRLAHGGTLFLTEIGDLPLPLQVKLLTVLDDHEFFPLGASRKVQVDVRLIAATHRDLKQLVEEGGFRSDLYYRLNVLRAHLPPLRQREGDIRLLLDHFRQELAGRLHKQIAGFDQAALALLTAYPYPGNVRELRNIVEYAANVCQDKRIGPEHLPRYLFEGKGMAAPPAGEQPTAVAAPAPPPGANPVNAAMPGSWREIEKQRILQAMINSGGNRGEAAKILGWSRSTLWRKMKQHEIA